MVPSSKSLRKNLNIKEKENHSQTERKKFAVHYIEKAKSLPSQKKLLAHRYLSKAIQLDPSNFSSYYEKALLFLHQSKKKGKVSLQKANQLMKQSKNFVSKNHYSFWITWGQILHSLGKELDSSSHFIEADKKYDFALLQKSCIPKETLIEIFWKKGANLLEIASFSEEALDYKQAIQSFQQAEEKDKELPSSFWKDFGYAHLQLALLINDNRHYHKASEYLHKGLSLTDEDYKIWGLLGETYSQLYVNTLNEAYCEKANQYYAKAVRQKDLREDLWLDWAALLSESGRINHNRKKLQLSVEKCVRASSFSKNPSLVAQWVESLSYLGAATNRLDLILEAENKVLKLIHKCSEEADLWFSYAVCMSAFAFYYQDSAFYDLAIEKAQRGLSVDRSHAELWHLMGVLHSKIGSVLEDCDIINLSKKFFYKACDLKPACPEIYYDFAFALLQSYEMGAEAQNLDDSLFYFEKLFQHQKDAVLDHPEWLFNYAKALALKGSEEEEEFYLMHAVEALWQVVLIQPDFPGLYIQLALTCSHLGEMTSEKSFFQKAFHYYSIAAKKEEDNDQIWLEWGLSLIHCALSSYDNKDEELLLHAERNLSYAGALGNPCAYYQLACLYSLLGKMDKSLQLFEKAQKMKVLPPLEDILEDEWLEDLRNTEGFSLFLHKLESKENKLR